MQDDKILFTYDVTHEIGVLEQNIQYQKALNHVKNELESLNLNRGGNNVDGFVFENLHVANKNRENLQVRTGEIINVIDDNGIADFRLVDSAGNVSYQQAKMGYGGSNKYKITTEKYGDQLLVVDKGNKELVKYAENIGLQVEESSISKDAAHSVTEVMQKEGTIRQKIGLSNNAPITSNLYVAAEQLGYAHAAGINAAKGSAAFAAGISIGKNMYSLIEGNMELRDFFLETTKETAIAAGGAYVMGGTSYLASGLIANTSVGAWAANTASVVVNTAVGETIVSLGPVMATMSTAAGPVFLLGMAIGTGYSVIKSLKLCANSYQHKMSGMNKVLDQVLFSMQAAHQDLKKTIKETYFFWNQNFDRGFTLMKDSIWDNDANLFFSGLDMVLNVFDSHVLFKDMKAFDDFFFDENAVLTL